MIAGLFDAYPKASSTKMIAGLFNAYSVLKIGTYKPPLKGKIDTPLWKGNCTPLSDF